MHQDTRQIKHTDCVGLVRFGSHGPALSRAGWDVIPLPPGRKAPNLKGWQRGFSNEQADQFASNEFNNGNIGLLAKNFPGVDIDVSDAACAEAIQSAAEEILGAAPVRFGSAPKRLLMYRTDKPFSKVKVFLEAPDGSTKDENSKDYAIEFLGDGQQYVINGRHPSGIDYTWPNGDGPGQIEVWELSTITEAQVFAFIQQLPQHLPPGWSVVIRDARSAKSAHTPLGNRDPFQTYKQPLDGWTVERVEHELLAHLNPDMQFGIWLRVLMAIHHQFKGSREALEAVVRWSMGSSKFKKGEIEGRWKSFNQQRHHGNGAVTLASVIMLVSQSHDYDSQGAINELSGQYTAKLIKGASAVDLEALQRHVVDLTCCATSDFTEHEFVVDLLVPMGEATLLGGHGGSGKSSMAITTAIHVALGLPFGQHITKRTRVLIVSAEDHGDIVRNRIIKTCATLNVNQADLEGWLFVLDLSEVDAALAVPGTRRGELIETPTLRALGELVSELDIGLTIIDNVADVFAGDEINRREVRSFIRAVRQRLARPSRAVVLLAHLSKAAAQKPQSDNEDYSGSTAWHNSVRSRLSLTIDGTRLKLTHQKSNYGPKALPIHLRWNGSVPVPVGSAAGATAEAESLKEDCRAVLKFIANHSRLGDPVPTATQGPATTFGCAKSAPELPEHLRLDKLRFNTALRSLENDGYITRQEIKKHRRSRLVFMLAPGVLIPEGGEA